MSTTDIYTDKAEDEHLFDFSINLKITSCTTLATTVKYEKPPVQMKEFLGLGAKIYSMIHDDEEKRTAKRISKVVIKAKLHHDLYKQCFFQLGWSL